MSTRTCMVAAVEAAVGVRSSFLKAGLAAVAAIGIISSTAADAAPLILSPSASGTHRDNSRNGTVDFSFQSSIVVRWSNTLEERGAVEFNLNSARTAVAGGATFNTVHFTLTGRSANTDDYPLQVYGFSGNGLFGTADHFAGDFITSQVLDNAELNIKIDVTDFVLDMLEGSATHAGFSLRAGQFGGFAQFPHGSGVGPRLVFDYVERDQDTQIPEPASLALLGMGLVALGVARRRTRQR